MRGGAEPDIRTLAAGETLVRQGEPGDDLFLLLDGLLHVDVDGKVVAELAPGAILGERALLEGGVRTSTLIAATAVKVAVAAHDRLDPAALERVSRGHRREERAE
jgi:CRP-like cAMP-binding protein